MAEKQLVTIEVRFVTEDDPNQLGDRVRESVAMIVGKDAVEEYRVRSMPLAPPKRPRAV
jgi:hypothetical protein